MKEWMRDFWVALGAILGGALLTMFLGMQFPMVSTPIFQGITVLGLIGAWLGVVIIKRIPAIQKR